MTRYCTEVSAQIGTEDDAIRAFVDDYETFAPTCTIVDIQLNDSDVRPHKGICEYFFCIIFDTDFAISPDDRENECIEVWDEDIIPGSEEKDFTPVVVADWIARQNEAPTGTVVWVAVATYCAENDIPPLVAVGRNKDEAADKLADLVRTAVSEYTECDEDELLAAEEQWDQADPVAHTI